MPKTSLSLPIHVAQDQGYFAAEGLDVRLVDCSGGHRCLRMLRKVLQGESCSFEGRLHRNGRDAACSPLLFLDIDRFKSINDTRGHAAAA